MGAGSALAEPLRDTMLFVADSKLVSQDTVEDLCEAGIRFVSRLPNTFGIEQTTKAQARKQDQWETIGVLGRGKNAAVYRLSELPGTIREKPVRLIVVHSSALEAKAAHWEEATFGADLCVPGRCRICMEAMAGQPMDPPNRMGGDRARRARGEGRRDPSI